MPSFDKGSFLERAATMRTTLRGPILLINKTLKNRLRNIAGQEYYGFPHIKAGKSSSIHQNWFCVLLGIHQQSGPIPENSPFNRHSGRTCPSVRSGINQTGGGK